MIALRGAVIREPLLVVSPWFEQRRSAYQEALLDLSLDVVRAMAETLHRELGDRRYEMPKTLLQLTQANQLGRKSGIGIFDYSGENPKLNPAILVGR